jgi:hypothetical protein
MSTSAGQGGMMADRTALAIGRCVWTFGEMAGLKMSATSRGFVPTLNSVWRKFSIYSPAHGR